MKYISWMVLFLAISLFLAIPFSAICEDGMTSSEDENGFGLFGLDFSDIEITIDGVTLHEVLDVASGMFADAVEENVGMAVEGLNEVFGEFSEGFSEDLGEIGTMIEGKIYDSWLLRLPAVSFDTKLRRSTYDSAFELYDAQITGKTDKDGRIASYAADGCGNSVVYIYDETDLRSAILESVEKGLFNKDEIMFGLEGECCNYAVSAVLTVSGSDEARALCDMTDLTDEEQFNFFINMVTENAAVSYDEPIFYGNWVLTMVFWNQDVEDWLVIVAKEVPVLLE